MVGPISPGSFLNNPAARKPGFNRERYVEAAYSNRKLEYQYLAYINVG